MMENAIELSVVDGVWVARHIGPYARKVESLFGTTTLPTAYLAAMPAEQVVRKIAALNAGFAVTVRR